MVSLQASGSVPQRRGENQSQLFGREVAAFVADISGPFNFDIGGDVHADPLFVLRECQHRADGGNLLFDRRRLEQLQVLGAGNFDLFSQRERFDVVLGTGRQSRKRVSEVLHHLASDSLQWEVAIQLNEAVPSELPLRLGLVHRC